MKGNQSGKDKSAGCATGKAKFGTKFDLGLTKTLEKRWGGRGGERIDTALLGEVEVGLNWVESVTGRIWKPQMS